MHVTTNQSSDSCILNFDGEITLQYIAEIKQIVLDAINTTNHVILDLQKVTDIDISCLQLLCSAHRTSIKLGKDITLSPEPPASFKGIVEKAGYKRQKGCALDADSTCMWKEVTHG